MTQRILGPRGSRPARSLLLLAAAAAVFAVFFVSGASSTLPGGSTFSAENGRLVPTSPAIHDWNVPAEPIVCGSTIPSSGTNCGLDLVKNSGDNALGQGSKEDQLSVTVVDGSIPPSKDDLSRFYLNHEKIGTTDFLYLAWERSNLLGSAHLDFELNKNDVGLTSSTVGAITLNRTDGDKLIDFDFGGSGVPSLTIRTWTTTGTNAPADCEASNSYPCWSKGTVLPAGVAESSVNCGPVTDTNPPSAPRTLDGNSKNGCNATFGEAGINLQAAGIIGTGTCTSFTDAWVKSRSSGNAFGSELKDIIAPVPLSLTNCGALQISKTSSKSGNASLAGAEFTVTYPDNSTTVVTTDSNGHACLDTLPKGTYKVQETKPPDHYQIDDDTVHSVIVPASEATCADDPFVGVTIDFEDSPLTDLDIKVASQDSGPGGSNSTITCTNDSGGAGIGNSPQGPDDPVEVTATGLAPGDYTCKVNIDP